MSKKNQKPFFSLKGHILIAMPGMEDSRFRKSVIFICEHNKDGAMGIVLNKLFNGITFADILQQLNILKDENDAIANDEILAMDIYRGGPVETGRGFVLHSPDYLISGSTHEISDGISLTETLDVLKDIHQDNGPEKTLLALGYAGWSAGQLENEMQKNGWLHAEATSELVFDTGHDDKYVKALASLGIDPALLSIQSGHA